MACTSGVFAEAREGTGTPCKCGGGSLTGVPGAGQGARRRRRNRPTPGDRASGLRGTTSERSLRVRSALDRIPDGTDRRIVVLRIGNGMSFREISKRLGLGYDRVRERYEASMRLLEDELGGCL